MEEIPIKQRDIILIPFPYSDQTGIKVRPAIVLSNNEFNQNQDLIVAGITSNISKNKYTIQISEENLELKNIKENCCIKVENLLKIDKSFVIKKIDKYKKQDFNNIIQKLRIIFEPDS